MSQLIDLGVNDGTPFNFEVTLDGLVFFFEFFYDVMVNNWFFNWYDGARDPIVTGQPVVVDYPWDSRIVDNRKPTGKIYFIDTSGQALDCATAEDLGARVKMVYD